jgi:hypothetical protein
VIARLVSMLDRLSRGRRRALVIVLGLIVLGAVVAGRAEKPSSQIGHRDHPAPSRTTHSHLPTHTGSSHRPPPVSAPELVRARAVAARFLAGYLLFAYGRAPAGSVSAAMPGLRGELVRDRAQLTPIERRRHPRVISLHAEGRMPGVVVVTAMIEDGGIASYALRLTVQRASGSWLVSSVDAG